MTRRTVLRALIGILIIAALFLAWDLLIYPLSRGHGVASPGDATATARAMATPASGTPASPATPESTIGLATRPAQPTQPAQPTRPAQPTQPAQPTRSAQPTQPAQPTRSAQPTRPAPGVTPRATAVATPVRVPATVGARLSPTLSIRPGTSYPDAPIIVAGHGFIPGERVTLRLDGIPLPGIARATASGGRFTATFVAPDGLPRAIGHVVATGATSGATATVVLRGASPAATTYVAAACGAAVGPGRPAQLLLALSNPASQAAHVRITLYFGAGATDSAVMLLRAGARRTMRLASVSNVSSAFGLALTAGHPIVARMLLARANARTTLPGTARAARTWYLTGGYAGSRAPGLHEVVALLNPDPRRAASVTLRLLVPSRSRGHVVRVRVRVPAHGETTVDIGKVVLPRRPVGIVVMATRPIAVARVLTVGRGAPLLSAGSDTLYRGWVFAATGAAGRSETYLSILNPMGWPSRVDVASYDRGGALVHHTVLTVAGLSGAMVALSGVLRAHPHGVISVVTGDAPIAVERMVYPGPSKAGRGKR